MCRSMSTHGRGEEYHLSICTGAYACAVASGADWCHLRHGMPAHQPYLDLITDDDELFWISLACHLLGP